LAGKADKLLGPDVQRAIAANYPGSKVVELDCGHELLVEKPYEAARHVAEFAGALPG
jgi:pimeloyl-ACP methyl ester carboxylesterase